MPVARCACQIHIYEPCPRSCLFLGWSGVGQGSPQETALGLGLEAQSRVRRLAAQRGLAVPHRGVLRLGPGCCLASVAARSRGGSARRGRTPGAWAWPRRRAKRAALESCTDNCHNSHQVYQVHQTNRAGFCRSAHEAAQTVYRPHRIAP